MKDAEGSTLTAAERAVMSRIGQRGGHARWSQVEDRSAATATPRAAFLEGFRNRVDPDGLLPAAERDRLANEAMSQHFAEMGRRSAEARRNRREARSS
jgi:hypothetical protein